MPHPLTEDQLRGIYRGTIDRLYGYVSRRCGGDRALAEDVTQETWLRAVREWRNKGVPEVPLAWLTTVARNLLLNELRKRRPLPLDDVSPAELMGAVEAGGASDSAEVAAMVNQALARLPDPQSRLLEAFHFDRIRCAQIAESLGISERAVEGRLRRARESLRRELEAALHATGGTR
jgi:RNA polymerase sigma-70 factor (ECF subfamily)